MDTTMSSITVDCEGQSFSSGDRVRILEITPDVELDEDDLEMFMNMVGSICSVERIDSDGAAWVAIWWNGDEGTVLTQIGLAPHQMQKMTD